ncbi:MAG: hypothetical protein DDT40_01085 [candidate division WS2 bacterium]|nr:hypothetical protein [Candidatus Psychracetigena formicireducens]
MPYVTVTDISAELSYAFTAATVPTIAIIGTFIAEVEADINGVMSSVGVSVPLMVGTSPGSVAMVRQAVISGVCARTLGAHAGIVIGEAPKEALYWQRYRDFVNRVRERPMILYDAPFNKTLTRISSVVEGDPDYHERSFTMGARF